MKTALIFLMVNGLSHSNAGWVQETYTSFALRTDAAIQQVLVPHLLNENLTSSARKKALTWFRVGPCSEPVGVSPIGLTKDDLSFSLSFDPSSSFDRAAMAVAAVLLMDDTLGRMPIERACRFARESISSVVPVR